MPARYLKSSIAPKKLPKFLPLDLKPVRCRKVVSGNSSATAAHRVHVAERGADDEVEALARQAPEHLLGGRAFEDVLDIGDVRVLDVLAEVAQALVVGLAPAGVVMWSDEDHRDVELALFNIGDLELALGTRGPDAGTAVAGSGARRASGRAAAATRPEQQDCDRQERETRERRSGHASSSDPARRTDPASRGSRLGNADPASALTNPREE